MNEFKKEKPLTPKTENPADSDLDFVIMPKGEGQFRDSFAQKPPATGFAKWQKPILVVLGVIIAGLGSYLIYAKLAHVDYSDDDDIKNPAINISVPDANKDKDLDNDGLTGGEEKELGTKPNKADTDGDGLADGDEVNIYASDPLLVDTDGDTYPDGQEPGVGFSPIVNSKDKAGEAEQQAWKDRIAKFGLHEPSLTTLKVKPGTETAPETETPPSAVIYTNTVYKYSISVPGLLAFREQDDKQKVGLYIAGTTPDPEDDAASDAISVTLAVKADAETLKSWIESQYPEGRIIEKQINGISAISVDGISADACKQTKTFYEKGNTIVVLTLTCADNQAFASMYQDITASFKFQ